MRTQIVLIITPINPIKNTAVKTLKEAADEFRKAGISVSEWSRQNGFKLYQVRDVLRGKSKGNFGEVHKIAVALGIKERYDGSIAFGGDATRD